MDLFSNAGDRPDRPLVVKCSYNRSMRRVTFGSALNCNYTVLRAKVEQCFSLYGSMFLITYADDDGEITEISSDLDLTEAINYFYDGDDAPSYSGASGSSGRSGSSRKVTLRVQVTLDNDGPSLSDTASLASLEEYSSVDDRRAAGSIRLSDSGYSLSFTEPEEDARTVSSHNFGNGFLNVSGPSGSRGTTPRLALPGYALPTVATVPPSPPASPNVHAAATTSNPFEPDPGSVSSATQGIRQLALADSLSPSQDDDAEHNPRGNSPNPFNDDDFELQRSEHHYYYEYTADAPSNSGGSGEMDGRGEFDQARQGQTEQSVDLESLYVSNNQQTTPHGLAWLATQQTSPPIARDYSPMPDLMRSPSAPGPSQPRPDLQHFVSDPVSSQAALQRRYPDVPPEVLRFVPDEQPAMPGNPQALTDCSLCGVLLDAFRYVCTTCGEKDARRPVPGQVQASSAQSEPDSEWDVSSMVSDETFFAGSHTGSSIALVNLSPRRNHSDPSSSPPQSTVVRAPQQLVLPIPVNGYELCSSCINTAGLEHAVATEESDGPSPSLTSTTSSLQEMGRNGERLPRTKRKNKFRHAFREKMWGEGGWKDVEHDDISKCSICSASLLINRYKCLYCDKFDLCRSCYSQVHDIHPSHAFLSVPDKRGGDLISSIGSSTVVNERPEAAETLAHPGVKCTHCLQDIVGARFHCTICTSVDICANCEAAGLPGNLTAPDGGHDDSHIMIKIPYPLESAQVELASRKARNLWARRDAHALGTSTDGSPLRMRSSSFGSDYSPTVIGSGRSDEGARYIYCRGCNELIEGIRYQCAHCPSLPTSYSLCSNCEPRSYDLHDPMHAFFKIPRPVDRAINSPFPILPLLYKEPVAQGAEHDPDPKAYLERLLHRSTLCDRCVQRIQGEWFRCVYCAKDLCADCEEMGIHDPTHIFVVFKAPVDMDALKVVTDISNPTASRPLIPFQVYAT